MKRSKRVLILAAVLAAVCAATLALRGYEEKKEQIQNSEDVILEIPADTVQALSWEYTEDGLSFHRDEEGWRYDDDEAFPVSEDKISEILSHFEAFGVSFIIENVEDYGQYGLDEPECVIHLTVSEEETYDIRLGAFSKMDEQRYVDIGDGNVYLVSEDPMDYIESSLSGMIQHDDTPGFETVTDIRFSGGEDYTIVRTEDSPDTYSADDVYFAELDGENLPLDTERVKRYLNTVSTLDLLDYVTYNATEELASFGLDAPELTVTVDYVNTDEEGGEVSGTCVLHISRNPEEQAAYEEAEAAGDEELPDVTKYVRVGDSQIVYTLDDVDYSTLSGASDDDLRHREVLWADFDDVTRIDITLEEQEHTITADVNEDEERIWLYQEEELDIGGLQSALEDLSADSFTDETPSDLEEIGLVVHLDNENFPEVEIRLYRYNGSLCLAVVDGEPVSLVARSAVMDLVEAVQAIVLN